MDNTGIQPVMPIGGMGDSFGGGFIWVFAIIAILLFGNGGFGVGGNGNTNAIQADVNRGFDNQNLQNQTRDILTAVTNGTAQTVAATNQSFHDSLGVMQNLYNETARDIAALAVGQANLQASQAACCCDTKQLIMTEVQGVKDLIQQNKIEALQAQISALQLQAATANTLKWPNSWAFDAGYFPPLAPTTTTTR